MKVRSNVWKIAMAFLALPFVAISSASAATIGFEAEAFTTNHGNSGFAVIADASALGGTYIETVNDTSGPTESLATYNLNFTDTGDYTLYGKFSVEEDNGGNDSLFIDETLGAGESWTSINSIINTSPAGDTYFWLNLSTGFAVDTGDGPASDNVGTYTITSTGSQDFDIGGREDGLRIDAFVMSSTFDPNTVTGSELDAAVVPEPASGLLATICGLVALGFGASRRRRK